MPFSDPIAEGPTIQRASERAIASKGTARKKKGGNDLPTQCGPESKIKLTVVKRDERKLKEALDKVFCDAGVDVIATFTIGQAMPPVRDAAATPSGGPATPDGETDLRAQQGRPVARGQDLLQLAR